MAICENCFSVVFDIAMETRFSGAGSLKFDLFLVSFYLQITLLEVSFSGSF